MKFGAPFKNNTAGEINLMWISYDGVEVLIWQEIGHGYNHREGALFTDPKRQ